MYGASPRILEPLSRYWTIKGPMPVPKASIAFAVWDGAQRDRAGKKLVTMWQELELEE